MAKFKQKYKNIYLYGGDLEGGYSTPEGTFDASGKKIAGPGGQPLSRNQDISANQALGIAQTGLGAINTYNTYKNPNATLREKQESATNTVAGVAGAINPIVGGIISGANMLVKPVRDWAEETNPDGTLKRRKIAKIGATTGGILDPSQTAVSFLSGVSSPEEYVSNLEKENKERIAIENQRSAIENQEYKYGGELPQWLYNARSMAIRNNMKHGGNVKFSKYHNLPQEEYDRLTRYNGYNHTEGGIPLDINNEVQNKETRYNDYIFSNDINVPGKKYSFAKASKMIDLKYSKRDNDNLSAEQKTNDLKSLENTQEEQRFNMINNAYQKAFGGSLNFKSKNAYKNWLGYVHATGLAESTPGSQKVSIKGKPHKVEHEFGGEINEYKSGGKWIQSAIKHPGRCTPGSPNYDCPPGSPQHRLAQRFRSGEFRKHEDGGTYYRDPYKEISDINQQYGEPNIPYESQSTMPSNLPGWQYYSPELNTYRENQPLFSNDATQYTPIITPSERASVDFENERRDIIERGSYGQLDQEQDKFDHNSLYNLGNFAGSAYDIYRGLKGASPVNFQRVKPSLVDLSVGRDIARRDVKEGFRDVQRRLKDVNAPAQYLNLLTQTAGRRDKTLSDITAKSAQDQANINAQILNQYGPEGLVNAQIQQQEAIARQQEKDVSKNLVSIGLYNAGMGLSQIGSDKSFSKQDDIAIKNISLKYPNWKYNKKTNTWSYNGQTKTSDQLLNGE